MQQPKENQEKDQQPSKHEQEIKRIISAEPLDTAYESENKIIKKLIAKSHSYDPTKDHKQKDNHNHKSTNLNDNSILNTKTITNLLENINCTICHYSFIKPVSLTCGHTFCQSCITRCYYQTSHACPVCKQLFVGCPSQMKVNLALENIRQLLQPYSDADAQRLSSTESLLTKIQSRMPTFILNYEYLPNMVVQLNFFEPRYKKLVDVALNTNHKFLYISPDGDQVEGAYGLVGTILEMKVTTSDTYLCSVKFSTDRYTVTDYHITNEQLYYCNVQKIVDIEVYDMENLELKPNSCRNDNDNYNKHYNDDKVSLHPDSNQTNKDNSNNQEFREDQNKNKYMPISELYSCENIKTSNMCLKTRIVNKFLEYNTLFFNARIFNNFMTGNIQQDSLALSCITNAFSTPSEIKHYLKTDSIVYRVNKFFAYLLESQVIDFPKLKVEVENDYKNYLIKELLLSRELDDQLKHEVERLKSIDLKSACECRLCQDPDYWKTIQYKHKTQSERLKSEAHQNQDYDECEQDQENEAEFHSNSEQDDHLHDDFI